MTEMFGEAWPPMSVPDLAPDDDDDIDRVAFVFPKKSIDICKSNTIDCGLWYSLQCLL